MKPALTTLKIHLRLLLCFCLILPHQAQSQTESFVPKSPASNETYSQFYNSISITELEALNLNIAQLLRQSLYWGTPGSTETPPTQSQVNALSNRISKWKKSLDFYLPQLFSTAHPLSDSGYSRLGVEVSLYFEAARKLELLKHLNRMGLSLDEWQKHYALSLALNQNADQLFLDHIANWDTQKASHLASFTAKIQIQNGDLIAHLELNPELIEEFEFKAIGRFQATNESTVKLAQLTGANFLLDNLAEVQFLQNENLNVFDEKVNPYWDMQFPALRHKSFLWKQKLQQRRMRFLQDSLIQFQMEALAEPFLRRDLLGEDFTRLLADDFLTAWKITGQQKSQNIDAIAGVYAEKLSFGLNAKFATYLHALLRLWSPEPHSSKTQLAEELKAIVLSAFGHMLRYELIYYIQTLAPQRSLDDGEYFARVAQVKSQWEQRIRLQLVHLESQVLPQEFDEVASAVFNSFQGGVENSFKTAYVKDLVQKANRTREAIENGEVQLWILNESLQGLYRENNLAVSLIEGAFHQLRHLIPDVQSPVRQNNFSVSLLEALNTIASQVDYFASQAMYYSTLNDLLPSSLLASELYDDSSNIVSVDILKAKIEQTDLSEARKQQVNDFILAGQWMGFFESHNPVEAVRIDALTALPDHVKDNYRHRLEHLTVNLHPILSVEVTSLAGTSRSQQNLKLIDALKEATAAEASQYISQALNTTQNNILHYLNILTMPYKSSLLDQITGQTHQLKDEFYSVVRYSTILQNEFSQIPNYASTMRDWIDQRETPSEALMAWDATESFLFDKVLWVLLGVQLATFLARVSPLGKVGSLMGWMHSTILAPVFGTGSKWLHRAILLGLGVSIGGEIYEVVSEYNLLGQLEGMLQTTAYEDGLIDSPTYFEQLETAQAASQALLIKLGILAGAMVAIVAAGSVIPRYLARRSFNKLNKSNHSLFENLGTGPMTVQTTRAELEAAYSATTNRIRGLHNRISIGQALRMKHELNSQFRGLLKSLNREASTWQKTIHRNYNQQIRSLYLNNAEFAESLGFKLGEPITSEMVSAALSRWQAYAQSGQISAFEWARIQDSAQQLLRALTQREQIWSSSLLYGDGTQVGQNTYANSTGAWNPELMELRWKEQTQPLKFEVTEMNGMELFTPVRTDIALSPRTVQWENLLQGPPTRLMLEDLRHLRWESL